MNVTNTITQIFFDVDNFCQIFLQDWKRTQIASPLVKKQRSCSLATSEIITILIFFHLSHYRNFKAYYQQFVRVYLTKAFPGLVSYNRFVELMPGTLIPLLSFINRTRLGKVTGISFIDSTMLAVCNNYRIYHHKVFKNIAKRGKSSTGWFFGFKLHLVINDRGDLLSFMLTPGNTDDRNEKVIKKITSNLYGKLFGDKGYLSHDLFEMLFDKGIQLITKIKQNMKNKVMNYFDKLLLRKRGIIESVNDELKNICQIEHSRHRSPKNFFINLISGLVAYTYLPKRPSLNLRSAPDYLLAYEMV